MGTKADLCIPTSEWLWLISYNVISCCLFLLLLFLIEVREEKGGCEFLLLVFFFLSHCKYPKITQYDYTK